MRHSLALVAIGSIAAPTRRSPLLGVTTAFVLSPRPRLNYARCRVATAAAASDVLPAEIPRRADILIALDAVARACDVTDKLQPLRGNSGPDDSDNRDGITTVTKPDASPVTVGDFAAQGVVLSKLAKAYPLDAFIAEERSDALRANEKLCAQVLRAAAVGGMDGSDVEGLWRSIDLGHSYDADGSTGDRGPKKRVWCLDPIDGTKGFLRGKLIGGQYCVALALIENGIPTIGILGCPNLPSSANDDNYAWADIDNRSTKGTRGCIFVATKDGGAFQLDMNMTQCKQINVTPNDGVTKDVSEARFCIGVEKGFSDPLGQTDRIAEILHGPDALDEEGEIVISRRIDSQAKFGVIARGGAEVYLRLPKVGYQEWIWDLAAGSVVITEAGGQITDVDGNNLDFSCGAKLPRSHCGTIGSNGGVFQKDLLKAYRQQELARIKTE